MKHLNCTFTFYKYGVNAIQYTKYEHINGSRKKGYFF